jgi:hypothetical protein
VIGARGLSLGRWHRHYVSEAILPESLYKECGALTKCRHGERLECALGRKGRWRLARGKAAPLMNRAPWSASDSNISTVGWDIMQSCHIMSSNGKVLN